MQARLHAQRPPPGGCLNLGAFFSAQPDTPAKLAGFAFAFAHLEIACGPATMTHQPSARTSEHLESRAASARSSAEFSATTTRMG